MAASPLTGPSAASFVIPSEMPYSQFQRVPSLQSLVMISLMRQVPSVETDQVGAILAALSSLPEHAISAALKRLGILGETPIPSKLLRLHCLSGNDDSPRVKFNDALAGYNAELALSLYNRHQSALERTTAHRNCAARCTCQWELAAQRLSDYTLALIGFRQEAVDRQQLRAEVLHCSAGLRDLELTKHLVEIEGAALDSINARKENILLSHAKDGNTEIVEWLLKKEGIDPYHVDTAKWTALHHAANLGHYTIARMLMTAAPKLIGMTNSAGDLALHLAAFNGHADIVELFLDAKVDIETRGQWEATPLIAATSHNALPTVELLLRQGAKINEQKNNGWTALHKAAAAGFEAVVSLLLAHGADSHVKTTLGKTPLHIAAEHNQSVIVELLIYTTDCEINAKATNGWTPLHEAAVKGKSATLSLLVENGAQLEALTEHDRTPLYIAAEYGNVEAVLFLMAVGANPHIKDKLGLSPWDRACRKPYNALKDAMADAMVPAQG